MKSTVSVGIAVVSSFLLICHFCTFVSCEATCGECSNLDDQQGECICPPEVQRKNLFPFSNQRAKRGGSCDHHSTRCESTGDPHFTTFKGNRFHILDFGIGVYSLVRLNSRSLWIQAQHIACNGRASCNCGVMAREGNSIVGITTCNRASPELVGYQLDGEAPTASISKISDRWWKIYLASGIEVEAIIWEGGQFMHLYIKGLESEVRQNSYAGLCSVNVDDVKENSDCNNKYCNRQRVNDNENYFSITQSSHLGKCKKPPNYPKCTIPQGVSFERQDITHLCKTKKREIDEVNVVSKYKVNSPDDLNNDPKDSEVVDRGPNLDYRIFGNVRSDNNDPGPVKNVEDGRSRCNDALKLSPTYELCSGRIDTSTIVENCALDENIMKEDGPAKSVPTEFETVCLSNIRSSIEADASSQELKDLLAKVEKLVCPSQCSHNGKCVDSKCQCNDGFTGTDCSQRLGQAYVVKK